MLEAINPSEMYGNCMTERSYIECTASSVSALAHYRAAAPPRLHRRLDRSIARGVRFLLRKNNIELFEASAAFAGAQQLALSRSDGKPPAAGHRW